MRYSLRPATVSEQNVSSPSRTIELSSLRHLASFSLHEPHGSMLLPTTVGVA